MKTILSITSILAAVAVAALPAKATTYLGTGTSLGGSPADGAAISSVLVNNDASTISFTINTTQNQASWIFYAIDLQIIGQAGSGYTGLSNPIWAGSPTIGISTGENAVLNDNGGATIAFTYSGGTWTQNASGTVAAGGTGFNYVTITESLSNLGLSVGDSFYFDVVSTYTSWQNGSPQSAYGALDSVGGYPAETNGGYSPWNPTGPTYFDSATDASGTTFGTAASMYTVAAVPEPATLALLSGGAILLMVLRRNHVRQ